MEQIIYNVFLDRYPFFFNYCTFSVPLYTYPCTYPLCMQCTTHAPCSYLPIHSYFFSGRPAGRFRKTLPSISCLRACVPACVPARDWRITFLPCVRQCRARMRPCVPACLRDWRMNHVFVHRCVRPACMRATDCTSRTFLRISRTRHLHDVHYLTIHTVPVLFTRRPLNSHQARFLLYPYALRATRHLPLRLTRAAHRGLTDAARRPGHQAAWR
jgi:hypothetical protein